MREETTKLLRLIEASTSLQALRATAALPEPDSDDGYYFISYSHLDYKPVLRDVLLLGEEGVDIWYDRGLESGKSWIREVSKKISSYSCRGVLFYITEAFLASPSCLAELCHFLSDGGDRGALFLIPNGKPRATRERLIAAVRTAAGEGAPISALLWTLSAHTPLSMDAPLSKKLAAIRRLPAPALLRYSLVRLSSELPFRFAAVTDLRDRNAHTVTIPPTCRIGGRRYRVRGIAEGAFRSCEQLTEVRMGRFFMLEDSAFSRCPSLRRVVLGSPARFFGFRIGLIGHALEHCGEATLTHRGRPIRYIGSFRHRTDLTEVTLPRRHYIAGNAFLGCTALTSVALRRYDRLDDRTFSGCTALRQVSIPPGNKTKELHESFRGCTSLEEIRLPRGLVRIGADAFRDCRALTEIRLPRRLSEIDPHAFLGCTALSTVLVDCRDCRFLENTPYTRRTALDVLFPHAERFYLRFLGSVPAFDGRFREIPSDRAHYHLFVREEAEDGAD